MTQTNKEKKYWSEYKKFINIMDSDTFRQYRKMGKAEREYDKERSK